MRELFDRYWAFALENFGPLGPIYGISALGAFLILLTLPFLLRSKPDPVKRLQELERKEIRNEGARSLRADSDEGKFKALSSYLEPTDTGEMSEMRARLIAAGYRSRAAVRYFYLARSGLTIGIVCVFVLLFSLTQSDTNPGTLLILCGVGAFIGFVGPSFWVSRRRDQRQKAMGNGFPDALDLMLVCVEAGQSLDQAVTRVAQEMRDAHEVLAEELQIVSNEMRAGRDRPSILRDFADRTGVSDIAAFVTVLIQSAAFGTPVAQALRVYAAEMRDKRLVRAEEKANKLPTKLTLGTMMFTVPPLLIILIGPSIIEIMRAFARFGGQ